MACLGCCSGTAAAAWERTLHLVTTATQLLPGTTFGHSCQQQGWVRAGLHPPDRGRGSSRLKAFVTNSGGPLGSMTDCMNRLKNAAPGIATAGVASSSSPAGRHRMFARYIFILLRTMDSQERLP